MVPNNYTHYWHLLTTHEAAQRSDVTFLFLVAMSQWFVLNAALTYAICLYVCFLCECCIVLDASYLCEQRQTDETLVQTQHSVNLIEAIPVWSSRAKAVCSWVIVSNYVSYLCLMSLHACTGYAWQMSHSCHVLVYYWQSIVIRRAMVTWCSTQLIIVYRPHPHHWHAQGNLCMTELLVYGTFDGWPLRHVAERRSGKK